MRLLLCSSRIFKTSFGGLCGPQGTPTKGEIAPSSLLPSAVDSRNRIPSFLQGIMSPRGVLHYKNEAIRGVAKNPEKMRRLGPAAILGAPSAYVESENGFFKKAFQLKTFFFAAFWLPSRWSRDTVEMQGFELAAISVPPSCLLYTSPSPRDGLLSRMPSSA